VALAAEKFGQRPSAMLGILDEAPALDLDLGAWGVLHERERTAREWETYREREGRRELAYMVGLIFAGKEISETPRPEGPHAAEEPRPATVEIVVAGEHVTVPPPPPGWVYDNGGQLFCVNPGEGRPIGDTGLRTRPRPRVIGCPHANFEPVPGGSLKCLDCGSVGN